MPKNPKKVLRWMTLLCIVIGLAAIAVGVVAVAKEEYIRSEEHTSELQSR